MLTFGERVSKMALGRPHFRAVPTLGAANLYDLLCVRYVGHNSLLRRPGLQGRAAQTAAPFRIRSTRICASYSRRLTQAGVDRVR
jgi:hypothetical protein